MTSPMTSSHLPLSDLERPNSRSLRFRRLMSSKGAELGHMLLLNIDRKAYMGSPMTLHSHFQALYLVKELSYTISYY